MRLHQSIHACLLNLGFVVLPRRSKALPAAAVASKCTPSAMPRLLLKKAHDDQAKAGRPSLESLLDLPQAAWVCPPDKIEDSLNTKRQAER
jgi:hypothetical protein